MVRRCTRRRAAPPALRLALALAAWLAWPPAALGQADAVPGEPATAGEAAASPFASDALWTADEAGRSALFELVARRVEEIYWDPGQLDWDAWRSRHRGPVVSATTEGALDRAFARMFDDIGDDHTRWLGPTRPVAVAGPPPGAGDAAPPQLGAEARPLAGRGLLLLRVHPGGAAEAAGLRRGDVIVAVSELPLGDPGAGRSMRGLLAAALRRGPTPVAVDRARTRLTAVLDARPLPAGAAGRPVVDLDEDLSAARLEIPSFAAGTAEAVHAELAALERSGVPHLVLDLRGNPGGSVTDMGLVLGAFTDGVPLAAHGREGVSWRLTIERDEAALSVRLARDEGRLAGRDASSARLTSYTRWDRPVAVLVDGRTASAAEAFAGALAAATGAVVVGSPTPGNVETIRRIAFPGGRAALVAVADLRRGDGTPVAPVRPDAEAHLDPVELARGLDAPFAEAVRLLRGFSWVPGAWF